MTNANPERVLWCGLHWRRQNDNWGGGGGGANDHICAICLTNFFEIDCFYIVEYEYINISPLNHCSAGASGGLLLLFIVVGVWNNVADLEDVPATNY